MFGWFSGEGAPASEPATDYQLADGSGVFVCPDTGTAYAGTVEPDGPRGGDWVWTRAGEGDAPPPAPDGWQDGVVRAWRS